MLKKSIRNAYLHVYRNAATCSYHESSPVSQPVSVRRRSHDKPTVLRQHKPGGEETTSGSLYRAGGSPVATTSPEWSCAEQKYGRSLCVMNN